jgi:hypothetical protein
LLGGLDGDEPARNFVREQDSEIVEKSGRPALEIERIERVRGEEEVGFGPIHVTASAAKRSRDAFVEMDGRADRICST